MGYDSSFTYLGGALGYLKRLDHLRIYAALLVLFHHFRGATAMPEVIFGWRDLIKVWLVGGASGVSLFLVLSGFLFCVASDAGRSEIDYWRFVKRRILRILPLLSVLLAVVLCINRASSSPMDILRVITLQLNTGNPMTGWGHDIFPVGPIWTIAVEFQFYLIFPFLAAVMAMSGVRVLFGMIFLLIVIKLGITAYSGEQIYYNLYHTIIGRLDQFLVGMIFGVAYVRGYCDFMRRLWLLPVMGLLIPLAILTVMLFNFHIGYLYNSMFFTAEAVMWGAIIVSYIHIRSSSGALLSAACAYFGRLSYSIYLVHLPVGVIFLGFLGRTGVSLSTIPAFYILLPVILVSMLTYHFVERPFLTLRAS